MASIRRAISCMQLVFLLPVLCTAKRTLSSQLQDCEKLLSKGADCPTEDEASKFYDCIREKIKGSKEVLITGIPAGIIRNEYRAAEQATHVIDMLKLLCKTSAAASKSKHGLQCTSTPYWDHPPCELNQNSLRFPMIGDWGFTKDNYPGETKEFVGNEFAQHLAKLHKKHPFDFVLNLGDSVYPDGVASEAKRDEQMNAVLKQYSDITPVWYGMLGNHDFGQITTPGKNPSIKLSLPARLLSTFTEADTTGRWILPEPYYTFTYVLKDPTGSKSTTAHFIVADTQILCGADYWHEPTDPNSKAFVTQTFIKVLEDGSTGHIFKVTGLDRLKKHVPANLSRSDYLFVVGHYNLYTVTKVRDGWDCMLKYFSPEILADQFEVSAYLSAHEHLMEHLVVKRPGDREIHYAVSGEGSNIYYLEDDDFNRKTTYDKVLVHAQRRYKNKQGRQIDTPKPGFIHVELTHDGATFHFSDASGKPLKFADVEQPTSRALAKRQKK